MKKIIFITLLFLGVNSTKGDILDSQFFPVQTGGGLTLLAVEVEEDQKNIIDRAKEIEDGKEVIKETFDDIQNGKFEKKISNEEKKKLGIGLLTGGNCPFREDKNSYRDLSKDLEKLIANLTSLAEGGACQEASRVEDLSTSELNRIIEDLESKEGDEGPRLNYESAGATSLQNIQTLIQTTLAVLKNKDCFKSDRDRILAQGLLQSGVNLASGLTISRMNEINEINENRATFGAAGVAGIGGVVSALIGFFTLPEAQKVAIKALRERNRKKEFIELSCFYYDTQKIALGCQTSYYRNEVLDRDESEIDSCEDKLVELESFRTQENLY